jgi:hypothetical protein
VAAVPRAAGGGKEREEREENGVRAHDAILADVGRRIRVARWSRTAAFENLRIACGLSSLERLIVRT